MSKSKSASEIDNVRNAIVSLYDLFPEITGCRRSTTPAVIKIDRAIKERQKQLENDSKLIALKAEKKKVAQFEMMRSREMHRRVDAIMRRFNLRGVNEQLLSDIEKLASCEPIIICDDCD